MNKYERATFYAISFPTARPDAETLIKGFPSVTITEMPLENPHMSSFNDQFRIISEVESRLGDYANRQFCLLTPRATVAIYAALRLFRRERGKGSVVMPANISVSVPSAVSYSGFTPIFCDCNKEDFNISLESLENLLDHRKDVKGILGVHLYGNPCNMKKIQNLASRYGLFVIEDAAHAIGGKLNGKPIGSFGDVSLYSFGAFKIIDNAQAGAFLTDSEELMASVANEIKRLQPYKKFLEKKKEIFYYIHHRFRPLFRGGFGIPYQLLLTIFEDTYLHRYETDKMEKEAKILNYELDHLRENVKSRRENARLYRNLLKHPSITNQDYDFENGVPWAYNLLVREQQQQITKMMRSINIHVLNSYSPVHWHFPSGAAQDHGFFSASEYIAKHILNLQTHPSMYREKIENNCDILLGLLENYVPEPSK